VDTNHDVKDRPLADDSPLAKSCCQGLHLLAHMIADHCIERGMHSSKDSRTQINPERRPGRPRAISEDQARGIVSLYENGLGYRAIARELEREGIVVTFSTVRRVIKTRERLAEPQSQP